MDLPEGESYRGQCDRPIQYERVTIDGKVMSIPIFVACDPNVSQRDLGDPPPDRIAKQWAKVSNPAPVQR